MGFPFHSLTQTTTAKCAYCGIRFDARRIFYKAKLDSTLLAAGIAVISETLPKRQRMIETYCSLYHAKRHKALTLHEHEQWCTWTISYPGTLHTRSTHCTKGHILIPENIYVYGKNRVCKVCALAYNKLYRRSWRQSYGHYRTEQEAS